MATLVKEDVVALEALVEARLSHADPLSKVLARVLIEKGIITGPELVKKLRVEKEIDQVILQSQQQEGFTDSRGKKWIR